MWKTNVANESILRDRLCDCLARQVPRDRLASLERSRQQIAAGASARIFLTAFSAVSRYTGKATLKAWGLKIALMGLPKRILSGRLRCLMP